MSKLEKLVIEDKAIRRARVRLVRRERKLTNALKQYRGDLIQIDGTRPLVNNMENQVYWVAGNKPVNA